MARIYAGTSGFAYKQWKPAFYPEDLPSKRFLEYYATRLTALEVNYTFRRTPTASVLNSWLRDTPDGFQFAMKAPMRITHLLRLRGAEESTERFLDALEPIREAGRLGPLLFQLPPNFQADIDQLKAFLLLIPERYRVQFEFRHQSWFADAVYDVLRNRNAALCVAESDSLETPPVMTGDFAYFRLRKPPYGPEKLAQIAATAREQSASGRDVFLIFKHEDDPRGALCAEEVLQMTASQSAKSA